MRKHIDIIMRLGKARIASLATMTMIAGYILAYGSVSWALVFLTGGVFALACGASALNQIQERDIDAKMARTRHRPLPAGATGVGYAVIVALGCLVVGSVIILASSNVTAMVLGLLTVFWYNAVYTPLKRVSAFAAVPGGVVGAIPPVIGWVAAGGSLGDPKILAVAVFFFMWQIPHFWLLLLMTEGGGYERAGLPSLLRVFSLEQVARVSFMWLLATAVVCMLIPLFGVVEDGWLKFGLLAAGAWLVWRSSRILGIDREAAVFQSAFKMVNTYALLVISLLAVGGLLG